MFTAASVFDCRLVHEHDRDVVLDGVDPTAGVALEAGAFVHQPHGRFALGTDQDFDERRIDGHTASNYSQLLRQAPARPGETSGDSLRICHNRPTMANVLPVLILLLLAVVARPGFAGQALQDPKPSAPSSPVLSLADLTEVYVLFMQGRDQADRRDTAGAIASYRKALALAPSAADVRAELAGVYVRSGQIIEARVEARREASTRGERDHNTPAFVRRSCCMSAPPCQRATAE